MIKELDFKKAVVSLVPPEDGGAHTLRVELPGAGSFTWTLEALLAGTLEVVEEGFTSKNQLGKTIVDAREYAMTLTLHGKMGRLADGTWMTMTGFAH